MMSLVGLGVLGGIVSGVLGVGGGIVFVPLMMLVLKFTQRRANATSLLAIVPTAIVGATSFTIEGEVAWVPALLLGGGAIAGSRVGSRWLRRIDERRLRIVFLSLVLAVGVRFAIEAAVGAPGPHAGIHLGTGALLIGRIAGLVAIGVAIGVLSALLGVGGGIAIVPVLVGVFDATQLEAQATSLAAIVPSAISAVYWNSRAELVEWRSGIRLGIGGAVGAVLGSRIALLVPEQALEIGFGVLLALIVVQMARPLLSKSESESTKE